MEEKKYEVMDIKSFGTRSEPEYDDAGVWQKFNKTGFVVLNSGEKVVIPISEVQELRGKFKGLVVEQSLTIDYDKREREQRSKDYVYHINS